MTPSERINFIPTSGSPVTMGSRDRAQRVREAIADLQLVIDGISAQDLSEPGDAMPSLARHCSMFLRKVAVGDGRTPRLLDEDFCRTAGLSFSRIRRVSGDRRTLTLVPVASEGGYARITKLDDETLEPEAVHILPIGPQRLNIDVEWPLPGMVDWLRQPTREDLWRMRPEGLFEREPSMADCDEWLGQQLVLFDDRGVTLKDVIRVMINTEAAHAPPVDRLMMPKGGKDRTRHRIIEDAHIHTLGCIRVCGVRFNHAIVIETAMYLYLKLTRNESISRPEGAREGLSLGFAPEDAFSDEQDWLRFDGGLTITLGGRSQSVSHKVRAPR